MPTPWILDPDASLAATAGYTVTAVGKTGGVADLAGNPVKTDVVWSFSTGAA